MLNMLSCENRREQLKQCKQNRSRRKGGDVSADEVQALTGEST